MTDITYPYRRVLVLLLISGISYVLMISAWAIGENGFILIGQTLLLLWIGYQTWENRKLIFKSDDPGLDWGWIWVYGPWLLLSWLMPEFFRWTIAAVVIILGLLWCFVLAIWENIRFVLRRYFNAHIDDWFD
tara:strand:- start:535 stop:930 length:396 start_codon:yes stop_codon:yes gene_type:complete